MYNNAKTCVKLQHGISPVFNLQKGIKQGDTLSPYLFNMYINDINDMFNGAKSYPPSLLRRTIGCLMYADDLLILSESRNGLQNSLNMLQCYCNNWKLDLNVKKTKAMVFSTSSKKEHAQFMFGSSKIDVTDAYTYLGIKFTRKATFKEAIKCLAEKGNKAMYLLKSSLYTGVTFNPNLPLKIFDSTVRPILLYASEVWCCEFLKLLTRPSNIDKTLFESINNKFCKS